MENLPQYRASAAFANLGTKPPQPFVRGDSIYSPSGPQGSRLVFSEKLFDLPRAVPFDSFSQDATSGGGTRVYFVTSPSSMAPSSTIVEL